MTNPIEQPKAETPALRCEHSVKPWYSPFGFCEYCDVPFMYEGGAGYKPLFIEGQYRALEADLAAAQKRIVELTDEYAISLRSVATERQQAEARAQAAETALGKMTIQDNHHNDLAAEYFDGWQKALTELAAAQKRIAELEVQRDGMWADFVEQRIGDASPCPRCHGLGVRAYSSTATWRGGIGGQAITNSVCDVCWGSGNAERPWYDWRKVETTAKRIAELEQR